MTNFLDTLNAFRSSKKTRIAVYRPSASTNDDLYSNLVEVLSPRATALVVDQYFLTGAQSSEYDLWCPWMIMQFRGVFAVDRPTKAGISPHITKGGYSFDLIQPVIWQI